MGSLTGSELLARSLTSQGMDTLFFLMGGPMLETESACLKLGVRAIDTRHEQAAAMMAHAYSRTTRRPGVCMGCSGPGTTNLVTGVANAFVDAAPLIAVGGSSPRVYLGMEAFQEIDQVAIMRPITKWAERVLDARRIPELVATAFRQATTGRPGPAYLDLPGDVLGEAVDEAHVAFPTRWQPGPRAQGNPAAIADAVAMLERAERRRRPRRPRAARRRGAREDRSRPLRLVGVEAQDARRREGGRDGQADAHGSGPHPSPAALQGGPRLSPSRRGPRRGRSGDPQLRAPVDPDLRARTPAELGPLRLHGRGSAVRHRREGRAPGRAGGRPARRRVVRDQRDGDRHGGPPRDSRPGRDQ